MRRRRGTPRRDSSSTGAPRWATACRSRKVMRPPGSHATVVASAANNAANVRRRSGSSVQRDDRWRALGGPERRGADRPRPHRYAAGEAAGAEVAGRDRTGGRGPRGQRTGTKRGPELTWTVDGLPWNWTADRAVQEGVGGGNGTRACRGLRRRRLETTRHEKMAPPAGGRRTRLGRGDGIDIDRATSAGLDVDVLVRDGEGQEHLIARPGGFRTVPMLLRHADDGVSGGASSRRLAAASHAPSTIGRIPAPE